MMSERMSQHNGYFTELKMFVVDATGLAYYTDRDADLKQRVARRLDHLGMEDYATYLCLLRGENGARELDALYAELTIGETHFFRHPEQFAALGDVMLPDVLIRNEPTRHLRIWSAGCANGAEPHSIEILLRRRFLMDFADWHVTILATDINRSSLEQAQSGRYSDWSLRGVDDLVKADCFTREADVWLLKPEYRDWVTYQCHNLVAHPFPSLAHNITAFDIVFCRNLMIYLNAEVAKRLVAQLYESLLPGGWLIVSPAETNVEWFKSFATVNASGATVYRRPDVELCPRILQMPLDEWTPPPPVEQTAVVASPSLPDLKMNDASVAAVELPLPVIEPAEPSGLDAVVALANRAAWQEADHACELLLQENPLSAEAHYWRGLVQDHMDLTAAAEQSFRRAIYINRDFAMAHYQLALLYGRQARRGESARCFRNVLRLVSAADTETLCLAADGLTAGELRDLAEMQLAWIGDQ